MEVEMENNHTQSSLSIGGWIGTLIVLMIPIVNIIMLLVWGFGAGDIGRKRFCIATLILAAIGIVLTAVMWGITGFTILRILDGFSFY